jgi:serine/threonine protein kinase
MALPVPFSRRIRIQIGYSWYIMFILDDYVCRSAKIQVGDIVAGLEYMHSLNVVHGDLKAVCDASPHKFSLTVS